MRSSIGLAATPLARLGALAERQFASPAESIRAALEVACALTGHAAALLAERRDGAWIVAAVCGESFGLAAGDPVPLADLLPAGPLALAPIVIGDMDEWRRGHDVEPAAPWSRLGAATIAPLPASDMLDAAALLTGDARPGLPSADAIDGLRVLARVLAADRAQA
ncbi:MAG TPA: hypothetical protein VFQ80_00795, partial [Thermomicrobiales bacterium]|nr:hypothetical protein [Thermomicrobiales bacterium]